MKAGSWQKSWQNLKRHLDNDHELLALHHKKNRVIKNTFHTQENKLTQNLNYFLNDSSTIDSNQLKHIQICYKKKELPIAYRHTVRLIDLRIKTRLHYYKWPTVS